MLNKTVNIKGDILFLDIYYYCWAILVQLYTSHSFKIICIYLIVVFGLFAF